MEQELKPMAVEASQSSRKANLSVLLCVFLEWPDAVAAVVIFVTAIFMVWLTWGHWGDLQIDCGRELYVPAEILRGKLLYRDVWYRYGPLPPYLQAGLLALFGNHLVVFYLFGLGITITCALLLFEIGSLLGSRTVGLAGALAFLLQGFGPWVFNYIFPYSYAATMGLAFSLVCILFAIRFVLGLPGCNLVLAGLAAGLASLCKLEFGSASYLFLVFVLALRATTGRSATLLLTGLGMYIPGVLLCSGVYGFLFRYISPRIILQNWFGPPGQYLKGAPQRHFYAMVGFRLVPLEFLHLVIGAAGVLVFWYVMARSISKRLSVTAVLVVLAAIAAEVRYLMPVDRAQSLPSRVLLSSLPADMFLNLFYPRSMFLIVVVLVICLLYQLSRNPLNQRLLGEVAFGGFALVLGFRAFAEVGPFGFNVFYGVPLLLSFMMALGKMAYLAAKGIRGTEQARVLRSVMVAELIVFAILVIPIGGRRTATFKSTWGVIYVSHNNAHVAKRIVDFMLEEKRRERRVVILPEAPLFYALTGTQAPGPWHTLQPGFLTERQQRDYTTVLALSNTRYVLLTNRTFGEYGATSFGIDYDQPIYDWIRANYHVVNQFGRFWHDSSGALAVLVYQRNG
jgi:hypothetical protein